MICLICFYLKLEIFAITTKSSIGLILSILILIFFYNTNHRTISHSLIGTMLVSISFYFINPFFIASFFLGYIFHLIADSFTKTGVKIFYPIKRSNYGLKVINMHTTILQVTILSLLLVS